MRRGDKAAPYTDFLLRASTRLVHYLSDAEQRLAEAEARIDDADRRAELADAKVCWLFVFCGLIWFWFWFLVLFFGFGFGFWFC